MEDKLESAQWRGRIEARLDLHIESEELLLRSILSKLESLDGHMSSLKESMAIHGERSNNQHARIAKTERLVLWGGGLFGTIFTGLVVALLTGAL